MGQGPCFPDEGQEVKVVVEWQPMVMGKWAVQGYVRWCTLRGQEGIREGER